jgi:hypothetical protein
MCNLVKIWCAWCAWWFMTYWTASCFLPDLLFGQYFKNLKSGEMKRIETIIVVFFALFFSFRVAAQNKLTGRIKAEIVIPISVTESEPLNFGKLINSSEGGRVVLSPHSERVNLGGISGFSNDYFAAGRFLVTGSPNHLITVTLPQGKQKLYSNTPSQELTVSDFTMDIPVSGQMIPETNGRLDVGVGATLYVGNWSSSKAGIYTGTYELVFNYN